MSRPAASYSQLQLSASSSFQNPRPTTTSEDRRLPTLHQVVALAWTYRTIVQVWSFVPFRMVLVPSLMALAFQVLNHSVSGYAWLVVLQTAILLLLAIRTMKLLASSKDAMEDSLSQNIVRLPLLTFLATCWTTLLIVKPFLSQLKINLAWYPSALVSWSLTISFRLALALILLGLAVVGRYIGPKSIMRCSSVPLLINPLDNRLRTIWWNPSSLLLMPGHGPGDLMLGARPNQSSVVNHPLHGGRRYQHSPWMTIIAQVIMASVVGVIVAYACVLPSIVPNYNYVYQDPPKDGSSISNDVVIVILSCVMAVTMPLVRTVLDFQSHELHPKSYCDRPPLDAILCQLSVILRNGAFLGFTSPLVSVIASRTLSTVASAAGLTSPNASPGIRFLLPLGLWCGLMGLYVLVVDEAIRAILLNSHHFDLNRLLEELSDDETINIQVLDVILHSLLYSSNLVHEVSAPTSATGKSVLTAPGSNDRHERRRVRQHAESLSRWLLSPIQSSASEAPLEEDVLRICVMNALGGPASTNHRNKDWRFGTMSTWFSYNGPVGGPNCEPLCIALVRALCVHVQGLGDALLVCSSPFSGQGLEYFGGVSLQPWRLPPGLLFTYESSVRALSWCIVQSMLYQGQPIPDWKSSILSTMVPAALTSLFQLRRGIMAFSSATNPISSASHSKESRTPTDSTALVVASTNLTVILPPLALACDEAAKDILDSMRLPQGLGRIHLNLDDEDCYLWTKNLVMALR